MNRLYCLYFIIALFAILFSSCTSKKIQYQGYVEGENVYLAAPVGGNLIHLYVTRGQSVKKGDVIGVLDPNPQLFSIQEAQYTLMQAKHVLQDLKNPKRPAELQAIEAQIKQAEAQIRLASLRVHRNETLVMKHALDKDTLDNSIERQEELAQFKNQLMANLDLAHEGARIEQIKAQTYQIKALMTKLKAATWELQQKTIYAPAAGLIFDTYYKQGEYVSPQRPIAALLTPENIRIDFFVSVQRIDKLKLGQKIMFVGYNGNERNEAIISYISPEAEYVPPLVYSRNNYHKLVFRIRATVKDTARVKPGQPVIVTIPDLDHDE